MCSPSPPASCNSHPAHASASHENCKFSFHRVRGASACEMGLDVGEIGMGADLSLDLRHFASKAMKQTRSALVSDMDAYIRRLEEERGKIEVFRRELPICARLLADVIDVMKEEAEKEKKNDRDEEEEEEDGATGDKSKWMSTAQLWTSGSGRDAAEPEKQESDKGRSSSEQNSSGSAFTLFNAVGSLAPASGLRPRLRKDDDKAVGAGMPDLSLLSPPPITSVPAAAAVESRRQVVGLAHAAARAASVGGPALCLQPHAQRTTPPPQPQQQQQARKSRRCWSPELHRQFVAALNQLGGPQVATPKQIRELMKVDELTNDEVKSHLQKYRLHTRRTPSGPAVVSQPIVLVGGLWIPHQEHSHSGSHAQSSGSPQGPLRFSPASGVAVSSAATAS